ncbi:MAG: DNRLRE domain-containing protein [Lysobacterales bacterium]|jgi:hypothetical protein
MRRLLPLIGFLLCTPLMAETVYIEATQDTTLYESEAGDVGNGSGDHFFVGQTAGGDLRRGLIAFKNLDSIPAGATVQSVKLRLHMSRTESPATTIHLLRVQANWGEGASDAPNNEGQGTAAEEGDATWVYRFFDNQTWNTPGGDFPEVTSASLDVGNPATYTFGSTSGLVADVQDWNDNPGTNFGWILIGGEDGTSTKRFDSRSNPDSNFRPVLEVEFSATGSPFDYSGLWYDPSLDGEGYILYKTPYGWLVYYFGYSSDGNFLWLVSDVVTLDQLLYGEPFELPMMVGEPGTFGQPTPSNELQPWGTLSITFNSCTTGEFVLDGADGMKTSNVVKLVGVEDTVCQEL